MTFRVTFYLPYPPGTVTRHTHHNLTLSRARTLAVREFTRHRKHGPVMILDDVGGVWAGEHMVRLLAEDHGEAH